MRTWTPNNSQPNAGTVNNPGVATGAPFQARLIRSYGEDTNFSRQVAEFEMSDGCRRAFQTASFVASDVEYINAKIASYPLDHDTNVYQTYYDPRFVTQDHVKNGKAGVYETRHFAFWYGTNTSAFSYNHEASLNTNWAQFLSRTGEWMEKVWDWDNSFLKLPMPYASAANPLRVNVYICGTGLPYDSKGDLTDCGASGSDALWISAVYLQYGSTTMAHEFGHAIEYYTGGFRHDTAGPFWETTANWNSSTLSPSFENASVYYFDNLENGWVWSNSRYGAFPVLMQLWESDKTHALLWDIWEHDLRDTAGNGLEDPVEAIIRLGKQNGMYPNGYTSFGDDMGWYGARLATGDFLNQKMMLDIYTSEYATTRYVGLATAGGSGNYKSLAERPLYEYGTHIIPLTPSGQTIQATLTGATTANGASWRFTIASLDANHNPVYAQLQAVDGTGSATTAINVVPGSSYFLVVTATPTAFQALGWEGSGPAPYQFPYTVKITGATPLTGSPSACTSRSGGSYDLNWNTNGHSTDAKPCPN